MRTQAKALGLLVSLMVFPGCYYAHLAEGQLRILRARQPIARVLADTATPPAARESLALVESVRSYAQRIGLRVGGQYRAYAAWPGDRVVTAVVATRAGEIEPAGFWFPVVGTQPYKGFFDLARAEREAAELRARGLDTCLVAVPAYSTLGWFDDPVIAPMLQGGTGPFVAMLLHELVHATVFIASDADFNESVATFVGQEAAVRFFAERGDTASAAGERERAADERAVASVLASLRARIAELYATPDDGARSATRSQLESDARAALRALPLTSRAAGELATRIQLQDACLALAGTYQRDLPVWARRLEAMGGDLPAFVSAARAAARTANPRTALSTAAAAGP
jgi:predicted aminopeptidase